MTKKIQVLHFVTGGFSGATQVVIDIIDGQKSIENIESRLVLRQKKATSPEKLAQLTSKQINFQVITGSSHLATIRQLRQIIDTWRPDVLVAHGFPEHLIGRWAGKERVPVLLQVEHGSHERYSLWRLWQTRYLSRFTTQAIGVSEGVADVLTNQQLHCPIISIANGVKTERFFNKTPLANRPKDVIMVARFSKGKNHAVLLQAIAKLKNQQIIANLTLLGSGSNRHQNRAKQLAKQLGISDQVDFLGHSSQVATLLAEHKIFVLATHYEGLSLSVIEAMSAGCVVMGSDVVGVSELIEQNKDGFLFDNHDVDSLANFIKSVLANPNEYQTMVNLAQQKASEHYDVKIMANNYAHLFQQLTAQQGIETNQTNLG